MAPLARQSQQPHNPESGQHQPQDMAPVPTGSLAKLAMLHEEASETARLANLLGACPRAVAGIVVLALATVWLSGGNLQWTNLLWLSFVAAAAATLTYSYTRTIRRPFARLRLKRFAAHMSAGLLFAGFAWGAGAYLTLPADGGPLAAALFVSAPALAIVLTVREREAVFLFVLPAAVLSAFAAVLRPFADPTLASALVVIASALVSALAMARDPRRAGDSLKPAMLSWQ